MGQFSEFDYAVGDYCRHLEANHNGALVLPLICLPMRQVGSMLRLL